MAAARASLAPATVAKGALRRLAQSQQEPTPENYARAYAEEAGSATNAGADPSGTGGTAGDLKADLQTQGTAWATLAERLSRNLERGGRQWTAARRKDSLKRVFDGSRSDAQRLLQRLQSLMAAWESDHPSDPAQTGTQDPPPEQAGRDADTGSWLPLVSTLEGTVRAGLKPAGMPSTGDRANALADELAALADAVSAGGAEPDRVAAIDVLCNEARLLFAQRMRLVEALGTLCRDLTEGLTELAEDDSWARGQCEALHHALSNPEGMSVRSVRSAAELLADTRRRQVQVRGDRLAAQSALRQLIQDMLLGVGELGEQTGRFQLATAAHVRAIEQADTLEGLAGVVRAVLNDARAVEVAVGATQQRLQADAATAMGLEEKVRALEAELRRLSDEVSTDALTQVANRRGLVQAFEAESARSARGTGAASALAVGLIDIDNFKRLNDTLGHAAGDVALKTLAAAVRERLRPADHLARFGGEEFVVLLPATDVEEGQRVLTRLQRGLTEALFLHDGREVFVTFSGGVTAWRQGETLQAALERADAALYIAKREGKNRTCVG